MNIEASSLLLKNNKHREDILSISEVTYTFISLPILRLSIPKCIIIPSLDYSCLLNKFSDIIMIKVLAVGIPHADATT